MSCDVRSCASIGTDYEFQGTTERSKKKIARLTCAMNKVPSKIFMARCEATSNRVRVSSLSRQKCRSNNPSRRCGCLLAVCSCGTLLRLMRFVQNESIIDVRIRLAPAPVSKRQLAVCMVEREKFVSDTKFVRRLCRDCYID